MLMKGDVRLFFFVEDHVFLKVSPTTKKVRFGNKGKLNLRFIGWLEIFRRVGDVSY